MSRLRIQTIWSFTTKTLPALYPLQTSDFCLHLFSMLLVIHTFKYGIIDTADRLHLAFHLRTTVLKLQLSNQ